jgi:deoxyribonuclease V
MMNWNVTPQEAIEIQKRLRTQVLIQPLEISSLRTVAGADLSYDKGSNTVYAGVVVLSFPELELIEKAGVTMRATFPYIPGLLSFREIPAVLEAWQKLTVKPDAIIADGQGIAHPRRFGIASHLGVLLGLPTVGCGKSLLVGKHGPLAGERGSQATLVDREEAIGVALRTREGVSPVYVSPGHRTDIPTSAELVLRSATTVRVPETTRFAHAFVNELRRAGGDEPVLPL